MRLDCICSDMLRRAVYTVVDPCFSTVSILLCHIGSICFTIQEKEVANTSKAVFRPSNRSLGCHSGGGGGWTQLVLKPRTPCRPCNGNRSLPFSPEIICFIALYQKF